MHVHARVCDPISLYMHVYVWVIFFIYFIFLCGSSHLTMDSKGSSSLGISLGQACEYLLPFLGGCVFMDSESCIAIIDVHAKRNKSEIIPQ